VVKETPTGVVAEEAPQEPEVLSKGKKVEEGTEPESKDQGKQPAR
jgi:hypothetical protein